MPKVTKNKKLSRVARRVAASDPLPMAVTTPKNNNNNNNDIKDDDKHHDPVGVVSSEKTKGVSTTTQQQQQQEDVLENQALSRGQRKRQAKREQHCLKKEKLILF